jgi:hypothetical protein
MGLSEVRGAVYAAIQHLGPSKRDLGEVVARRGDEKKYRSTSAIRILGMMYM